MPMKGQVKFCSTENVEAFYGFIMCLFTFETWSPFSSIVWETTATHFSCETPAVFFGVIFTVQSCPFMNLLSTCFLERIREREGSQGQSLKTTGRKKQNGELNARALSHL